MIHIGDYNSLTVTRLARGGCLLDGGEAGEIYLSKKETPRGTRPGDRIRVFVYNESKENLGATTVEPIAKTGDFAPMVVTSVEHFGVFLEWGISKDLFVPLKHLPQREKPHRGKGHSHGKGERQELQRGDVLVVYLTLDYEGRGVIGTTHLSSHFDRNTSSLEPNAEVDLIVFEMTKMGARVIIENRWEGLLYHGEIFEPLKVGARRRGYVKKIREDGLVDAALRPQGFVPASQQARETILAELDRAGGFLPLHDKSDPKQIRERLHMSKKLFKNTVGTLYKDGKIVIEESGIRGTHTTQNGF
jgi:hypothetical protein